MVVIYVRRISEGLMTIDDVPMKWREATEKELLE
ncbi:CD1375 family protein [Clostridium chromiireducens]|nr:CD1375 family protein [Clostridium chromiireducens]